MAKHPVYYFFFTYINFLLAKEPTAVVPTLEKRENDLPKVHSVPILSRKPHTDRSGVFFFSFRESRHPLGCSWVELN